MTAPAVEPVPRSILVLPDSTEDLGELEAPESDGPTGALHPALVYVMLMATVALALVLTL